MNAALRFGLLICSLCACVHSLPRGSADGKTVAATEADWMASGLPGPGDCLDFVEVRRHESERAYVDACDGDRPDLHASAARESAGCLTSALRGFMGRRVWIVHIAPGYHADAGLVDHELRHALTICHLRRPANDPFDATHTDQRVWK